MGSQKKFVSERALQSAGPLLQGWDNGDKGKAELCANSSL